MAWKLRSLDVVNPTGLVVCDAIDWRAGAFVYTPRREALFLGLCLKSMLPENRIVFNFNPRAQLFCGLKNIFTIAERLLDLTLNEDNDAKIGAWLEGAPTSLGGLDHAENLLVILRAEVMYLFGSICAVAAQRSKRDYTQFFDYFAAVNGQRDELLPVIVETVLGRELRSVFENLCGQYYFQSSSKQMQRREWLFQAERRLNELCAAPFESESDPKQTASLRLFPASASTHQTRPPQALFLPLSSSSFEADESPDIDTEVEMLFDFGVTDFIYVNAFMEQLRWVERLSRVRQQARLAAVREDPLRSQSFFDARSGRSRVWILTDATLDALEQVLCSHPLTSFSLDVQQSIETAFEVRSIRRATKIPVCPHHDQLQLTRAMALRTHPQRVSELLATTKVLEHFFSRFELSDNEFSNYFETHSV